MITLAPKKLIRTQRASEGSASEPSLARRVSMCKDAKLSCRGKNSVLRLSGYGPGGGPELAHGCAPTGERYEFCRVCL